MQGCENLMVRSNSMGLTKVLFKPNANYVNSRLKRLDIIIDEEDSTNMAPHDEVQNITPFFATHHHHHQVSFSELEELYIEMKNKLEILWHNDWITGNSFCKLQKVSIYDCNKLTYVFPSSMIKSLVFLDMLQVHKCENLEKIFEIEESMDDAKIAVPLTMLYSSGLPNLKYVWSNDPGDCLTFPNLKHVYVCNCPRLRSIFPASFIKHMDELTVLGVDGEMELFVEDEALEIPFFPSLTNLIIYDKLVEKRSFWHRSSKLFPKLQSLRLNFGFGDDGMVTLSFETGKLVYTIKEITIRNAIELVQVFENGEENDQSDDAKLKTLNVERLQKLTRVWEDNNTQMITNFDSLKTIRVINCANLKCLLPSSITFFNLTELHVQNCNGMMNLFSSSVANKLVNLTTMIIIHCEGMSSIVVAEGGEDEITFKRLKDLIFDDLPRLISFHSGKSMLKFPCLDKLYIISCHEMKTFTYGIISMPKLLSMTMDGRYVPVSQTNDVNVIVKNHWEVDIGRSIKHLFTQKGEEVKEEDTSS